MNPPLLHDMGRLRSQLDVFKPAAPARVHLLLAAMLWSVVGALLAFFGGRWLLASSAPYGALLLLPAVVIGLLKARFVLDRTAARIVTRIRARGDGRCVGGFLSLPTWGFVALMSLFGYLLRHSHVPRMIVGFIYVAIGVALLVASRRIWRVTAG
ncbi:MAG TPA: hypothetical protein PLQ87_13315 [Phycisphaerae bacterium]|nr:hypothetical protein [Phycisphaerae bacterium]